MPERPLVSVVTPSLNQAAFLERTLSSVRAQTYAGIEHIVVDGGSTDTSQDLLRAAGDAGTIRWLSEPDAGMYDAINKGLGMATGDVFAYLNADDAYLPWAVESAMAVFAAKPEIELVFGDGIKLNQDTGAQRLRLFPPFDLVSLANYESLMQPAVFWRRSLHERLGGFDRSMRYVADLDFWLRAAEAGAGIEHLDEVIAVERIHAGRLSASQQEAMAAEDRTMRARHAGSFGGPEGRERAKQRDLRLQVQLFRRFIVATAAQRRLFRRDGPWAQFLRQGKVRVDVRQTLDGSQPHQGKLLWNAVVSLLAAEVLGVQAPPKQKSRPLPIRLARFVLPRPVRRFLRTGLNKARAIPKAAREWRFETGLALSYRFSAEGRRSRKTLDRLRNTARGRRAVVIGNGPSLNQMDISVLKDVPTFGLNRGYLLFPRIGGPTTYLVSANRYVLEQSMDEMLAAPGPKFFNWRHRRFVPPGRDDVVFIHTTHTPGFSTDIGGKGLWEGATVTFVAMQLALHLGYRELVLIGVDHNFTTPGQAHKLVTSQGADPNHFDPSYFGAGYKWQLPDLEMSERAYWMAKQAFQTAGGSIVDATVGGKLTIFPKADFTELFPGPSR